MGVRCWDHIIILSSIQVTRANGGARAPKAPPLATLLEIYYIYKVMNVYANTSSNLDLLVHQCISEVRVVFWQLFVVEV